MFNLWTNEVKKYYYISKQNNSRSSLSPIIMLLNCSNTRRGFLNFSFIDNLITNIFPSVPNIKWQTLYLFFPGRYDYWHVRWMYTIFYRHNIDHLDQDTNIITLYFCTLDAIFFVGVTWTWWFLPMDFLKEWSWAGQ